MTGPRYGTKLVGNRPEVVPAQSAFGWLARIARLNHFTHAELYSVLGLRLRRADSLLHVLSRSAMRQATLANALGREPDPTWRPEAWNPFQGSVLRFGGDTLRFCPACIRIGYHTHLHQLPWFERCPWHSLALQTGCHACRGAFAASSDAGRPLLTCSCGRDLMDERLAARTHAAPAGAAEATAAYLAWAAEARAHQRLVGVADVPLTDALSAALIDLPAELAAFGAGSARGRRPAGIAHVRSYPECAALAPEAGVERGFDTLEADCPQLLELTDTLAPRVQRVAVDLARKLPSGSLTERELLLFLGPAGTEVVGAGCAQRPSSGAVRCLPPMIAGARRFLDLSCVHPVVLRAVAAIGRAVGPDASHGAQALALRLQEDLLSRGYAEGLRAVLSRYVPALLTAGRDRPHLTAAWAVIRILPPYTARVAFTRVDVRAAAADVLTAARARR